MIKNIKKKALMLILLLNLSVISEGVVYAAENQISLELAVRQTLECKNAEMKQIEKTGTYELSGLTEEAPMPDGSEENVYRFSLEGEDETAKIPLAFTRAGVYQYQLRQTTKEQAGYTYDRTNYKITVYIKNVENEGFISEIIAEDDDGNKCGELKFSNLYQGKAVEAASADISDPSDSIKTGDKIQMNLYIWGIVLSLLLIVFFFRKCTDKK